MNLISLKYFIAITEYSSFTKAAEHLYVTQPTLSRQIADLEDEFGTQLFVRNKRSVDLTDAGKICLEEARKIVSMCDNLVYRIKQTKGSVSGTLNVGYLGYIENELLTEPLIRLSEKYPGMDISMLKMTLAELNHFLMQEKYDLIYTVATGIETLSGVKYKKIAANDLKLVVSTKHPLANRDAVSVKELANERFVMLERNVSPLTVDFCLDMCVRNGFSPSILYYARDVQTLLLMVGAGKGVAFLSSRTSYRKMDGVKYLELTDCNLDFSLVLAYKENNSNPMIQLFLEEFSEVIE